MPRILQSKNLATRFQILVEIAANQPTVHQKVIAEKIGVTPQAVSDYVAQLLKDGLIVSNGRSRYTITKEGVDWVLSMTREIKEYCAFVEKAITSMSVCTAIAEERLSQGQTIGLRMHDGLLWAGKPEGGNAHGVAIANAEPGEDVGVSNIEGIVALEPGRVTIARVPPIDKGGSAGIDLSRLKKIISQPGMIIGAIGLEALSALRRINEKPQYFYGVEEAVIEAAFSGLSSIVVCVDSEVPGLIRRLESANLEYLITDLSPGQK